MAKHKKNKHNPPSVQQRQHSKNKTQALSNKANSSKPSKNVSTTSQPATKKHSGATKNPQTLTIPFDPEDRILLIGEGDFSFARSLVEHHHCFEITATSFDSRTELFSKYAPQAEENVSYLEDAGQTVLYNVDATKLDTSNNKPPLSKYLNNNANGRQATGFDRIIFNFPHIGGKSTDVNRQVRANQELLVNFFRSAIPFLSSNNNTSSNSSSNGKTSIIVTLFEGEPYTLWNIRDLARHCGLEVVRSFRFDAAAGYPGYRHARTLGNLEGSEDGRGAWKGEEREARSYVFAVKEEKSTSSGGEGGGRRDEQGRGKRKRGGDSDEDG